MPPIARIRVRFLRFTHVDDNVIVVVVAHSNDELRLNVISGDVLRAEIRVVFGPETASVIAAETGDIIPLDVGPLDNLRASLDGRRGRIAFLAPTGTLAADFPKAAVWLGAERIDALAAATRLVGMVYPGLYSLLGGIDVRTMPRDGAGTLAFEMGELRHGQIDATIAGGGILGTLDCRVPQAPTAQPSSEALRGFVASGRYAGTRALVVGGSRGAGEASAKLLALGGAEVTITYCSGEADAAAVAADIERAGGSCRIARYDAMEPAEEQLNGLISTHACWFATPVMVRPDSTLLDERRLAECVSILVSGFFNFAAVLHSRRREVKLLYPSMLWIDTPPTGLAEYLMAKAAAEALIRSMAGGFPGISILAPRLPAMATDQTARMAIAAASAAETMLPHLDRLVRSC